MRIRQHPSGYVVAGVFLFLGVVILAIILARGSVRGFGDLIIATIVIGVTALVAINEILSTAVPSIAIDGDTVQVRDRWGRHRTFARSEIGHVARRSLFAPMQYGMILPEAFMLVGKNGRCLVRLAEGDYATEDLERLVGGLGLEWPETHKSTVRKIRHEFPGAYAFDYQAVSVVVLAILLLVLAVAVGLDLRTRV